MNILLVEPGFPVAAKSKNHANFLPIGILKLASYYRKDGYNVMLVRGNTMADFVPEHILITSLFTYWSKYVWESVRYYKCLYPKAKVIVGGIYASLMPEHCKQSGCDEVHVGIHEEAEKCPPAYDLVEVDYQIIHAMRGCPRRCDFCGVWKIEPNPQYKENIKAEICKNRLIFYDNNFLCNPNVDSILEEIANTQINGRAIRCECQSGFDGRLLTLERARLLRKAKFYNPRIAWDGPYDEDELIREQIELLVQAGYRAKEIYVFMLYNYEVPFVEMERKRSKCKEWGVQIADCRYRPLDQTFDYYDPRAIGQTSEDYYIHPNWQDKEVKLFRKNVREQNICVRHGFARYDKTLERWGGKRRREKKAKQITS